MTLQFETPRKMIVQSKVQCHLGQYALVELIRTVLEAYDCGFIDWF